MLLVNTEDRVRADITALLDAQAREDDISSNAAALLFDIKEADSRLTFTGLVFKSNAPVEVAGLTHFHRPGTASGSVRGTLPAGEQVLFIPNENGEDGWVVPWRYAHFEREWTAEAERRTADYDSFTMQIPPERLIREFEYVGIRKLEVPRSERDVAAKRQDMLDGAIIERTWN